MRENTPAALIERGGDCCSFVPPRPRLLLGDGVSVRVCVCARVEVLN